VVTETTGRSAAVGSGSGIRGRATVSALTAGIPAPWGIEDSASRCKDTCKRNIPGERLPVASDLLETAEASLQLPAELQPPAPVDDPALPDWYTALREDWQARETAQ
jgi:hypothetical protein